MGMSNMPLIRRKPRLQSHTFFGSETYFVSTAKARQPQRTTSQRLPDRLCRAPSRGHGALEGGCRAVVAAEEEAGAAAGRQVGGLQGAAGREGVADDIGPQMPPGSRFGAEPACELVPHGCLEIG